MSTQNIQPTSIADLHNKVDGENILVVDGMLKKLGRYFSSKPEVNPPWSFQDAVIVGNGSEYPVTFASREELSDTYNGRVVRFEAKHGERGWTGIKIKEKEDRRTKTKKLVLWITPTATMSLIGSDPSSPPPQQPSPPSHPAQTQPAPAKNGVSAKKGVIAGGEFIGRNLSLVKLAMKASMAMKKDYEEQYKEPMSDAMLIAVYNSCIFGATNVGIPQLMPVKLDFKSLFTTAAQDNPEPPAPPPPPPPPPACDWV